MGRLSLGTRIGFSIAALAIGGVAGGIFTVRQHQRLAQQLQQVADDHAPIAHSALSFERNVLNARMHYVYHITLRKPGAKGEGEQCFAFARRDLTSLAGFLQDKGSETAKADLTKLQTSWAAYELLLNRVLAAAEVKPPRPRNRHSRRQTYRPPVITPLLAEWMQNGNEIVSLSESLAGTLTAEAGQETKTATGKAIDALSSFSEQVKLACAVMLVFGIGASVFAARYLNRLIRSNVGAVRASVLCIAGRVASLTAAAQRLNESSLDGAETATQVSSSLSEIAELARCNAERANLATSIGCASELKLMEAQAGVSRLRGELDGVGTANKAVSSVIRAVKDIAFQTDMLALNAAIEASRAGAAGQGFAIVADEVRSVAKRCSEAAKQTEELISNALSAADSGTKALDDMVEAVQASGKLTEDFKKLVAEFTTGSAGQLTGIHEIYRVAQSFKSGAGSSAHTAGQFASDATEIGAEAENLLSQMNSLAVRTRLG